LTSSKRPATIVLPQPAPEASEAGFSHKRSNTMDEWIFAQSHPSEELARLHCVSMKKGVAQGGRQGGEIEFTITVREYATPKDKGMQFFAQADKQTNQRTAAFTPSGWGDTLLKALAECVQAVHRFPYEGPERV
jgi:hypothetical protein